MSFSSFLGRPVRRRFFLRVAGATAASSALVLAGCDDDDTPEQPTTAGTGTLVFGRGNLGLLNYAYLLEQLEAAFYQAVVTTFPADFTAADRALFVDLRDHEVIHRETFKYTLGSNAYDANFTEPLAFDFSSFTLTTRAGVLAAARTLEDLGVAAYNGAGKLFDLTAEGTGYLRLAGKIASVEARHAAVVRELLEPGSFAGTDVVGSTGLDTALTPVQVLEAVSKYVKITLVGTNLPTL
ncbi:ferritin-like domain-containing protein [Hymenobacter weizhouensis]|uniref:ferritin-like domain-containing protein n=1 Tax=Hymenobacter sp. YIM 151500-1 TaxID=2987689 RepID=UPI002227CA97|nr:ferritin-like domain-containing protein [Hymenobacter sp. YIM 151500-1]UYZ63022.1 ferritin-like domain-containing protein [Hymenobacter sp. YIM 151500-1]